MSFYSAFKYMFGNSKTTYFQAETDEPLIYGFYMPQNSELMLISSSSIKCYDAESSKKQSTWGQTKSFAKRWEQKHTGTIHKCACFHPDHNYICTGDGDGFIRIYRIDQGKTHMTLPRMKIEEKTTNEDGDEQSTIKFIPNTINTTHKGGVTCIQPVPSDMLITGGQDGSVKVWNIARGELVRTITPLSKKSMAIDALSYDELHHMIIIGLENGHIYWYSLEGQRLGKIGHGSKDIERIRSMVAMNRSKFIAFGTDRSVFRVWNMNQKRLVNQKSFNISSAMLYEQRRDILFAASNTGEIQIMKSIITELLKDERNMKEFLTRQVHTKPIVSLYYHPDTDTLVSISSSNQVAIWKDVVKDLIETLDPHMKMHFVDHFAEYDVKSAETLEEHVQQQMLDELNERPAIKSPMFLYTQSEVYNLRLVRENLQNEPQLVDDLETAQLRFQKQLGLQKEDTTKFLLENRNLISEKYKDFIHPDEHAERMNHINNQYKTQRQRLIEKHKKELQALDAEHNKTVKEFREDAKVNKDNAAKTFKLVRDNYRKRMKALDIESSQHLRQLIKDISLVNTDSMKGLHPDKYKLLSKISDNVYTAIDFIQQDIVAIKLYPVGLYIHDRFRFPSIVPLREVISSDSHTFVIMEKMDMNISEADASIPLSLKKQWLFDIINTLDYIHRQGMIHREIQPSSIFLRDDHVFLNHVGIMKSHTVLQVEQKAVFCSPETISNRPCYASDVWSLGLLMGWLLQTPEERNMSPLIPYEEILEDEEDRLKFVLSKMLKICNPTVDQVHKLYTSANVNGSLFEAMKNITVKAIEVQQQEATPSSPFNNNLAYRAVPRLQSKIQHATVEELRLMSSMLQFHPDDRLSISKLIDHPYFKDCSRDRFIKC
mmetsp:Transcript_888/g.1392  ORF Transcript_888/g.1392 Transcript_888/m.1392 type:complete len:885 (+) Transcript_888:82-2736(+)